MIVFEAVKVGEILGPMATLMVGSATCWLIWRGLRQMERASMERDRQMENQGRDARGRHDEAMMRHDEAMMRHEEAKMRHEEAMTALRALIERTGGSAPSPRA